MVFGLLIDSKLILSALLPLSSKKLIATTISLYLVNQIPNRIKCMEQVISEIRQETMYFGILIIMHTFKVSLPVVLAYDLAWVSGTHHSEWDSKNNLPNTHYVKALATN